MGNVCATDNADKGNTDINVAEKKSHTGLKAAVTTNYDGAPE